MVRSLATDVADQSGDRLRTARFCPGSVLPVERETAGVLGAVVFVRRRAFEALQQVCDAADRRVARQHVDMVVRVADGEQCATKPSIPR